MLDLRSKSSLVSACLVNMSSNTPASHSLRLLIHQNNQILFRPGIFLRRLRGFTAFHHRHVLKCNIRNTERRHSEVRPLQSGDKVKCQLYIRSYSVGTEYDFGDRLMPAIADFTIKHRYLLTHIGKQRF